MKKLEKQPRPNKEVQSHRQIDRETDREIDRQRDR
jgi:hypothetical protein